MSRILPRPAARHAAASLVGIAALAGIAAPASTTAAAPAATTAATANVATISATLSPDRLGARSALTVSIHIAGGEFGVPAPLQAAVVRFPAGMTLEIPKLRSCSTEQLQQFGAHNCPAQSRLGEGHALVQTRPGAETISENVTLTAFLGPPRRLQPTLEVLGEGLTPIAVRMVVTGAVLGDRAPYGERLTMSIPPIPTLPLAPDGSLVDFSLTVGAKRGKANKSKTNAIVVPRHCPPGGFPLAAELSYADGTSGSERITIPCPR
ncbi:MAG TPA: hypothetical protein VGH21_02475 [Solirubrobacteraceae bacterium]